MTYKKNIYLFLTFDFISTIVPLTMIYSLFLQEGNNSLVFIGTLLSVYQIAKIVCEVPSGYLSDRFGRKRIGIAGQALFIVFLLLTLQLKSRILLLLAAAVRGIAYAALSGTFDSIFAESILESEPDRLEYWLGVDKVVFYAAYGFAGVLGGFLASWSLFSTMIIMIILEGIALVLTIVMKETTSREEREKLQIREIIPEVRSNPKIVYFLLLPAIIAVCLLPFEDYYSLLLKSEDISYIMIGFFTGSYSLIGALAGLFAQKVSKRFGEKFMAEILPAVIFILFAFMSLFLRRTYFSWVIYCLIGICSSLNNIAYNASLNRLITNSFRSTILSCRSLLIGITGMILSPLAGWMIMTMGYSLTFFILSMFGLIIYLIVYKGTNNTKETG